MTLVFVNSTALSTAMAKPKMEARIEGRREDDTTRMIHELLCETTMEPSRGDQAPLNPARSVDVMNFFKGLPSTDKLDPSALPHGLSPSSQAGPSKNKKPEPRDVSVGPSRPSRGPKAKPKAEAPEKLANHNIPGPIHEEKGKARAPIHDAYTSQAPSSSPSSEAKGKAPVYGSYRNTAQSSPSSTVLKHKSSIHNSWAEEASSSPHTREFKGQAQLHNSWADEPMPSPSSSKSKGRALIHNSWADEPLPTSSLSKVKGKALVHDEKRNEAPYSPSSGKAKGRAPVHILHPDDALVDPLFNDIKGKSPIQDAYEMEALPSPLSEKAKGKAPVPGLYKKDPLPSPLSEQVKAKPSHPAYGKEAPVSSVFGDVKEKAAFFDAYKTEPLSSSPSRDVKGKATVFDAQKTAAHNTGTPSNSPSCDVKGKAPVHDAYKAEAPSSSPSGGVKRKARVSDAYKTAPSVSPSSDVKGKARVLNANASSISPSSDVKGKAPIYGAYRIEAPCSPLSIKVKDKAPVHHSHNGEAPSTPISPISPISPLSNDVQGQAPSSGSDGSPYPLSLRRHRRPQDNQKGEFLMKQLTDEVENFANGFSVRDKVGGEGDKVVTGNEIPEEVPKKTETGPSEQVSSLVHSGPYHDEGRPQDQVTSNQLNEEERFFRSPMRLAKQKAEPGHYERYAPPIPPKHEGRRHRNTVTQDPPSQDEFRLFQSPLTSNALNAGSSRHVLPAPVGTCNPYGPPSRFPSVFLRASSDGGSDVGSIGTARVIETKSREGRLVPRMRDPSFTSIDGVPRTRIATREELLRSIDRPNDELMAWNYLPIRRPDRDFVEDYNRAIADLYGVESVLDKKAAKAGPSSGKQVREETKVSGVDEAGVMNDDGALTKAFNDAGPAVESRRIEDGTVVESQESMSMMASVERMTTEKTSMDKDVFEMMPVQDTIDEESSLFEDLMLEDKVFEVAAAAGKEKLSLKEILAETSIDKSLFDDTVVGRTSFQTTPFDQGYSDVNQPGSRLAQIMYGAVKKEPSYESMETHDDAGPSEVGGLEDKEKLMKRRRREIMRATYRKVKEHEERVAEEKRLAEEEEKRRAEEELKALEERKARAPKVWWSSDKDHFAKRKVSVEGVAGEAESSGKSNKGSMAKELRSVKSSAVSIRRRFLGSRENHPDAN